MLKKPYNQLFNGNIEIARKLKIDNAIIVSNGLILSKN